MIIVLRHLAGPDCRQAVSGKHLEIKDTQHDSLGSIRTPTSGFWENDQKHDFQRKLKESRHPKYASYENTHN